jgi:hypothetical protein
MHYELSDYEWTAIKPRSGAPWHDLPRQLWALHDLLQSLPTIASCAGDSAGIWDPIMEALAAAHDGAVQIIDTSVRACAPAWSLRRGQRKTTHGLVARRAYEQDSWTPMAYLCNSASRPARLMTTGSARSY